MTERDKPGADASITSAAHVLAIASAIWLRHAIPNTDKENCQQFPAGYLVDQLCRTTVTRGQRHGKLVGPESASAVCDAAFRKY